MHIPEKGKPVMFTYDNGSTTMYYSLGEINKYKRLMVSENSDGTGNRSTLIRWQEVEVTVKKVVPPLGTKVYCWNTDVRPLDACLRYSREELTKDGNLLVYEYRIQNGNSVYNESSAKYWEVL